MRTLSGILVGLLVVVVATNASAADLQLDGNRLLVSGVLDGTALKDFESMLTSGQVRTVVFENALGGSPDVAADYARAIQATGVDTEARGECQAACAYAFLAGKQHRFGRGLQVHALLIPVPAKPQPGELANRWQGAEASRSLAAFTGGAAKEPVTAEAPVTTAAGTLIASNAPAGAAAASAAPAAATGAGVSAKGNWQPNQGVLFTSTPTLFGRVNNSFYCDGTQGRDISRCELLPDADPYKLGVLTP